MQVKQQNQVEQLKQALREVRANRDQFSRAAFAQIVMVLLDRLRQVQTTPIEDIPKSDEIRLVTVMFIDIKDSTELAQQLDAGDWKTLIGEAHRRLATTINQWDGQIGQYLGDGILAFFGAQRSGGDDAVRAVSCALALKHTMQTYANEVFLKYGLDFAVRMGLSTGRVVVGMIGNASKQELLALGPATNLAARLQSIAAPDQIIVDTATYSRVRNYFVMQAQPAAKMKGYSNPVANYAVIERRTRSDLYFTDVAINGIKMPLVGRIAELRTINTLIQTALTTPGFQVATLVGDIGIGKSRLLQETLNGLPDGMFKELVMHASYEKRARSHNLLRDMLMSMCELTDDTPPEIARERIVAYVLASWNHTDAMAAAEVMGYMTDFGFDDSPHVQAIKSGGRDHIAFSWVARWLRAMAENQALFIVVDNLQWADYNSIALLEYLVYELDDAHGVLIAAGRPIYRAEYPQYMRNAANHTIIQLEQLPETTTLELIDAILAYVDRVPSSLAPLINERAEGNPLFVQEFLGMLFDNGVFQPQGEGRFRFNILQYDDAMLPNGLLGVLQARLDDLTPDVRQMIQLASVVGQTFWSGALTEMTGTDALPLLDMLVTRGMIYENTESVFDDELQFSFRHTLYRDVAYEMMPRAKREEFHSKVAEWLITRIHNKPEFFSMLAEQFEAGGRHDAALVTYLEAAQVRLQRGLLPETLTLIDSGLALARNLPRDVALPVVSQLWALRSQALNELNRFDEASAASQSALMLLEELPHDQLVTVRVQSARMMGVAYRSLGRYTEAFEALNAAYNLLPDNQPDTPLLASVLRSFGVLCLHRGQLDEGLAYQERAYTYAQMTGQNIYVTGSMTQLGWVAMEKGDLATALGYFERVLEINQEREYTHYQLADLRNIGLVYMTLLNYDRALSVFDGAHVLQEGIGADDVLLQAYRGLCFMYVGQLEFGLEMLEEALERQYKEFFTAQLVQLAYIQGLVKLTHYHQAHNLVNEFIQQINKENPVLHGRALLQRGIIESNDDHHQAYETLKQALKLETTFGGRDTWLMYAALARYTSDEDERQQYYIQAAKRIRSISTNLYSHPDLQATFLSSAPVYNILEIAGVR